MGVFNPLLFVPSHERQGKCRDFKDCNSLRGPDRVQTVRRQFLVLICNRQSDAASRHGWTLEFEQPPLARQRPSD